MHNPRSGYEIIEDATVQILENASQDGVEYKIYGYISNRKYTLLFYLLTWLTLGLPYVLLLWFPNLKRIRYKKTSLNTATLIYLKDEFGNCMLIKVHTEPLQLPNIYIRNLRYFYYQHTKYIWIESKGGFGTLDEFLPDITLNDLLLNSQGLTRLEEQELLKLYGPNTIEIEIKSYWHLFKEEVFNPFYIFQTFSIILWLCDKYVIYAACVLFLTIVSIITELIQTRKQSVAIYELVKASDSDKAQILSQESNSSKTLSIHPKHLLPGHLLIIPRNGCIMPCDAVLIKGICIVNESMLTGESIPVMKTPPNACQENFNIQLHKAHTLFAGTRVTQGRFYDGEHILARVIATGFETTKGGLVKSIMFPTPVGFKFYKDSIKFVLFLFLIAATGMSYCVYLYVKRKADVVEILIRTLDIITIVVPPALPAAMTIGIVSSQSRLKKLGIFCISPPRINISGKLKLACFDKTGTLTHEGLDLYCVVPAHNKQFEEAINDVQLIDDRSPLIQAMATCHSLTKIDGKINGDPLDLIMFQSTNWELEEPGDEFTNYDMLAPTFVRPTNQQFNTSQIVNQENDVEMPYLIGIIQQFQFSSTLQRMSVICRILGQNHMIIYTKGAPEKIQSMCLRESIPNDFNNKLVEYSARGYRVIALAYKELDKKFKWKDAQKVKRENVENNLHFLGFLIMQNTLKPETKPVLANLHSANIRTLMITGDNIMTAMSVARECGMVNTTDEILRLNVNDAGADSIPEVFIEQIESGNAEATAINFDYNHYHFAMDGRTWTALRIHYSDLLPKLLLRTTIFARFQPDHKTQLIKSLQSLDYIVSMVGDGANDCGALKAAHVGVSLSQAEASVAAPFTSSIDNISCLIHLMLEGRCALVTSFAVFKYMALYSLIQFFTIIILYKNNSILGDRQFLFIDLIITTSLALTIGRQGPSNALVAKRPMGSLIAGINIIPMMLQILLCGFVQYSALIYLTQQSWYIPNEVQKDEIIVCWGNTVLFTVSCFQYVILALVYSKGLPFRARLITNFWLLFASLTLTCITTYLCITPSKQFAEFFEIIYLPKHEYVQRLFKDKLLVFPIVHFIIAVVIENLVAESNWLKCFVHCVTCKKEPKNKYKRLLLNNDFPNIQFRDNTSA